MDSQLSILATFDDLRRYESTLTDGTAEIEFLRFAQSQDQSRLQWLTAVQEAQRLQRELDASLENVADLETKLYHARRILNAAQKGKQDAESERRALAKKISQAHELLYTENINEATRTKFAFLNNLSTMANAGHHHTQTNTPNGHHQQQPAHQQSRRSYKNADLYASGPILSDLSYTHSEDDFIDDIQSQALRSMRHHQQSFVGGGGCDPNASFVGQKRSRLSVDANNGAAAGAAHRHRSSAAFQPMSPPAQHQHHQHAQLDFVGGTDKIVASTRVSIPHGNGPITAESVIEAIPDRPQSPDQPRTAKKKRSPPAPAPPSSQSQYATPHAKIPKHNTAAASAPPLDDCQMADAGTSVPPPPPATPRSQPVAYATSASLTPRQHQFASRTFLKSDTCQHCQHRIKFGTTALKCRDCCIRVHPNCRKELQLACVPVAAGCRAGGSGAVTPKGGHAQGVIADYAPLTAPLVPALIVHCVNEIESRGLTEVGLYRVSGSEKDVKALKERFLNGKTVPALQHSDVHVLCGCLKDFLRGLREPLVPMALWRDFSNAAQSTCDATAMRETYRAIERMPAANRDTMAFLMQHFLRIARAEMVKMPARNIAKVFGPTIVGYSSAEPEQHAIFTETTIQASVMEKLLSIPADYWCRYLIVASATVSAATTPASSGGREAYAENAGGGGQYFGTPSFRKTARKNKFYATPPYPTFTSKNVN